LHHTVVAVVAIVTLRRVCHGAFVNNPFVMVAGREAETIRTLSRPDDKA
jgi:hypothetical protein